MSQTYETIRRVSAPSEIGEQKAEPQTWWERYRESLLRAGLSANAIEVIDIDSSYLLTSGIFGAGFPDSPGNTWPSGRLRRGLVMGSVQSGKTASLLAVTAKALDAGVNVVVILAGTRLALWRQTMKRTSSQLDQWSSEADTKCRTRRVFIPSPTFQRGESQPKQLDQLYFETPNFARRMLMEGKPLVAVVMKNVDHLMAFTRYLHKILDALAPRLPTPLHMLVIDDEADDGSVLDRDVEAGLAPDSESLKQIPRHIARMWSGHAQPSETLYRNVFATYLAYTATPQANFLQSTHNPLSPTSFVAALRTPSDVGSVAPPRQSTFFELEGLTKYYIGGEFFYRRLSSGTGRLSISEKLPETNGVSEDHLDRTVRDLRARMLGDAMRAYFVGGAVRLLLDKKRISIARSMKATGLAELSALCPSPHTMLFHPSAKIGEHFVAAKEVVDWCHAGNRPNDDIGKPWTASSLELSALGLAARLEAEEDEWRKWCDEFWKTRDRLSLYPGGQPAALATNVSWTEVKEILISEVFKHTRLAVINSDPRADDSPSFEPEMVGPELYIPPPDIFTIFVSGNVMARGITLEGLCVSMFVRSADEPLADTQMQMQRWFGYRGRHLAFCRLFVFEDQLSLFRDYHEGDEALRNEIIEEMNRNSGKAPSPLVLEGRRYRATGKIANLRALPLCPGPDPFVKVLEVGRHANGNSKVLGSLLEQEVWHPLSVGSIARGLAMERQFGLVEVAALLEALRFEKHSPNPEATSNRRWASIASELGLDRPDAPLFRAPPLEGTYQEAVDPRYCPYTIAAYLRLWQSMLTRRGRGFYPTDDPKTPWSMIDLRVYARSAPRFHIGIRFGQAGLSTHAVLAKHRVQRMDRASRDGVLVSTWGSRNPGERADAYLGDQLFDFHVHGLDPPVQKEGEPLWRPRGMPGLVLFHVIRDPSGGPDAIAVGLGIPSGGPDHIAALRSSSR